MKENSKRKGKSISMRIDENLRNELEMQARRHNCTLSEVVNCRIKNDSSMLDKRVIFNTVLDISFYLEEQKRRKKEINVDVIKERLAYICTILN